MGVTVIAGGYNSSWETEGGDCGSEMESTSCSGEEGAIVGKMIAVGSNVPKNCGVAGVIATSSLLKVVIGISSAREMSQERIIVCRSGI